MKPKYTKELLEPIVKNSISFSEVIRKIGKEPNGGMFTLIKGWIIFYNLDISHFKGQGWSHATTVANKRPIEDYLSNKQRIGSSKLCKRLIKDGYKQYQCESCNLTEWNGRKIPLELHHVDCNHFNNNLSNLLVLCPNCHYCIHHAVKTNRKSKKYSENSKSHLRTVERPSYQTLLNEINELGYSATGRKYNVSDNAIRKWVKNYEKYK